VIANQPQLLPRLHGCGDLRAVVRRLMSDDTEDASHLAARAAVVATTAFLEASGQPAVAARRSERIMMTVGRQAAMNDFTAQQLSSLFERIARDCLTWVNPLLAPRGNAALPTRANAHLRRYVHRLHAVVLAGHEQMSGLLAMDPTARRSMVGRALFGAEPVPRDVLQVAGIDTSTDHLPVVWVDGQPSADTTHRRNVLAAPSRRALLVPVDRFSEIDVDPDCAVVIGPARRTPEVCAAIQLTHRAASALRAGVVAGATSVTWCEDIAEDLLLVDDGALTDILIEKHLGGFLTIKAERRVAVARILLTWLETKASMTRLAEIHHVARQTAHDQLTLAKELVGPAIDDASAHAAIVVALHAALPRWRSDG
jgi:hypothetical protein